MLSALAGACPTAGVSQLSAPHAPLGALCPTSWCWQSAPAKAMPTLLLQLMLMAFRESPAWLQVSAVPLPQTLPSGSGKAGVLVTCCPLLLPQALALLFCLPPGSLPYPGLEPGGHLLQAQHCCSGHCPASAHSPWPISSSPCPTTIQGSMQDLPPAAISLVVPWQIICGCVPIPIVALELCCCPFGEVAHSALPPIQFSGLCLSSSWGSLGA